jgi:hypothetical protein
MSNDEFTSFAHFVPKKGTSSVYNYIASIRNTDKRSYAAKYLEFIQGHGPDPSIANISYMAAQAVRMRIREFIADRSTP